ncbi:HAMP domain-containing histidine kinase [Paenibacillus sp. JX-17]|uniref:Signal transduction histidine-protein kinase ArlS n=1 Tax=Paenibacillus lacisoli TaxID=3064525 RepID=A0ABT9CDZ2_9BACL|nr:HAMP domain-containing histidine kinase [Paenibacillus sp. JX-17]MDO7907476.1 HAMP domain-containing histidine kinase [Paenibacillus sp. JX-17]
MGRFRIRSIRSRLYRLPIRWKLAVWSALLLSLLFAGYNLVQYVVISQWLVNQEEQAIRANLDSLTSYFEEKNADPAVILDSGSFVHSLNQKYQMIRILSADGIPILTQTDRLPEHWVEPRTADSTTLISSWHMEDHLLILRGPLQTSRFSGTIEIVTNVETTDRLSNMMLVVMFIGGAAALVLSAAGGIFLSRKLVKPVQSMAETMGRIKQNGMQERVAVTDNGDELSDLARTFNELMSELEASFQQQKQFVEDASHELRTPLSIVEGHLSLLRRWGKDDPVILEESLNVSLLEMQRLKGIVNELLELSRAEQESDLHGVLSVEIEPVIRFVVSNFELLHSDFTFHQDIDGIHSTRIRITPQHLEQVLVILLDNAVKYAGDSTDIRITAYTSVAQWLTLEVQDYGIGIPPEDLPHIFDRFYRVDKARSRAAGGTGLGLAIAERLVRRYGGRIEADSEPGSGTVFRIHWPLASGYALKNQPE